MQTAETSIFGPGSDLWIVPERKNSNTVQNLDWYLNFQISKSVHHQPKNPAPQVLEILKKCALEGYDWAPQEAEALLILSSHAVPNRWVMVLKGSDRLEAWAETAATKWKKMNSPTVRVFLPQGVSTQQFDKLWKKAGGGSVTIVADRGSTTNG